MSPTDIIIGIALGVLLLGAVSRTRYRDVFGVLLILGIAAAVVVVTITQVSEHREEKAAAATPAAATPEINPPDSTAGSPPVPPDGLRATPPVMRGPTGATGAAAPPVIEHRYAGGSR